MTCRTRSSGAQDFAQFHIWVDPAMTVAEAHDVVEAIEGDLALEFPGCEVLIHLDPEGQGRSSRRRAARDRRDERGDSGMTELKLIQVDAFADRPFTGNPAAVMPLDAWLPDEVMQAIANGEQSQRDGVYGAGRERRGGLRAALVHADDRGRLVRPCDARQRPCPDRARRDPLPHPQGRRARPSAAMAMR